MLEGPFAVHAAWLDINRAPLARHRATAGDGYRAAARLAAAVTVAEASATARLDGDGHRAARQGRRRRRR